MKRKRLTIFMILSIFMAALFGGCAPNNIQAPDSEPQSFIINQSLSLAKQLQNEASSYSQELEIDADGLQAITDCDLSKPDSAIVITIDSAMTAEYFLAVQQMPLAEGSDELISFFEPKATTALSGFLFAVLVEHGYSISTINATNIFSATHIEKAPTDLNNAIVLMDYNGAAAITAFCRYGDYVNCTCGYIIPDMSDEELVELYDAYFEKTYDTRLLSGHTETIDSAQLEKIIAG